SHLIQDNNWSQVLVFARTKIGTNRLTNHLKSKGINATAIHGNKTQAVRTKALADFKAGLIQVLVATDIAARGLDIEQLPQVVNFDLPHVPEDYVHRIGRTGRAGLCGQAISLVSADEFKQLSEIERLIKKILPRKLIDDFEPNHNLPESKLDRRPFKPKKPKKPKLGNKNKQQTGKQSSTPKSIANATTSGWIKPGKRAPAGKNKARNSDNS
ncbi:MAG: ATP-dependent helicase, partial [Porticoccaceae bacterium]|nr:ATP-dependent helicase [Porticoccaceae bacterium]